MLEQLSELVKLHGQETVVNNPTIPNDQNNAVMAEAAHSISGGMQGMLAGGGLQDILSLFTQGGSNGQPGGLLNNPAVMTIVNQLVGQLVSKYNMSPAQATQLSGKLVPDVMQDLVSRTQDTSPSNGAFNLNSLIGSLTGGRVPAGTTDGGFDFQGLLGKLTGGENVPGNESATTGEGFNMQDIIGRVTNGAREHHQQGQEGGGLADLVKGFFN